MTAADLIQDLAARRIRLSANGDKLRVRGPAELLTGDLRDLLARWKPELLATLCGLDGTGVVAALSRQHGLLTGFGPGAGEGDLHVDAQAEPFAAPKGWHEEQWARGDGPTNEQSSSLAGGWEPVRDHNGLTWVERAERWREEWKRTGYPPGVSPKQS